MKKPVEHSMEFGHCAGCEAEIEELRQQLAVRWNFLCELSGYVARDSCFCKAWHASGQNTPCLVCRALVFAMNAEGRGLAVGSTPKPEIPAPELPPEMLAVLQDRNVQLVGEEDALRRIVIWAERSSAVSDDGEPGVNEGSPMCAVFNGNVICCRQNGHPGRHATPYPGDSGPVWVRWVEGGPWGSCHAGDPETKLYCCLETGHLGRHMAVTNQGEGIVLARWASTEKRGE